MTMRSHFYIADKSCLFKKKITIMFKSWPSSEFLKFNFGQPLGSQDIFELRSMIALRANINNDTYSCILQTKCMPFSHELTSYDTNSTILCEFHL